MSFRCEKCGEAQPVRTSPVSYVAEKRRVIYPERKKGKKVIDPGGEGYETVRQLDLCTQCAEKFVGADS